MNRTQRVGFAASWFRRLGTVVIWAAATAAIAYLVARAAADQNQPAGLIAPLPAVTLNDRATVSLESKSIVPIVSGTGSVVRGESGWLLEAPISSDELAYRLLDPPVTIKALINGAPSGFTCEWAGLGLAGGSGEASIAADATPTTLTSAASLPSMATGVTMRCQIPDDVRVVAGLHGMMVLQMAKPVTVSSLPRSAVLGSAQQGQVIVVHADGTTELRSVQLGASDDYNIEIVSGLNASESVLLNPVQRDITDAQHGAS
ncbi:MAG: hypothetical protein QM589_03730 [Thermomicrobiales bacterium]